jgi:hypothetical protein
VFSALCACESHDQFETSHTTDWNHLCDGGCAAFTPQWCVKDCHGTFRGGAFDDSCGVCSGGLSGHVAESDVDCGEFGSKWQMIDAHTCKSMHTHILTSPLHIIVIIISAGICFGPFVTEPLAGSATAAQCLVGTL